MKLALALDHDCNLECSYCYGGAKSRRPMDLDVMARALDLAFAHPSDVVRVSPFGGEPLLAPGLVSALAIETGRRAASTGKTARLTITTNGTLLSGRRLDILAENGFEVTVSLDGDEEAHDCARAFPDGTGSWAAVVRGIEAAAARLGPARRIKTSSVVHPGNVDRLGESFDMVSSLGVTRSSFAMDFGAAWDPASLDRLDMAVEEMASRVARRYRAGHDFVVSPIHDKIVSGLKGGFGPGDTCDFGCSELAVAPSGRIYPCDRLIGEDGPAQAGVCIGHVATGVDRALALAARGGKDIPRPDCGGCASLGRCMWWCGCANRALTGRVDGPSDVLCRMEQAWVRAADKVASALYADRVPSFMARYYEAAAAAGR